MLNLSFLSGQSLSYSVCFKHWTNLSALLEQSMASRRKKPPFKLVQHKSLGKVGGSKKCLTAPLMHYLWRSANIFFPKRLCLKSVMQIFPSRNLQTSKVFYIRGWDVSWPWNVWGKRILYWEVLLPWWALWSGRHCFPDCCNDKIWVLFSVLLLCSFSLPCVIVWTNCF